MAKNFFICFIRIKEGLLVKIYNTAVSLYTPQIGNKANKKINSKRYGVELVDKKTLSNEQITSFKGGNPLKFAKNYYKYIKAQNRANNLYKYIVATNGNKNFMLRNMSMEYIEGLQYGIEVFDNLSMKDIQYLSENLHVIAVKRGCNNMCGYCYADAKPQNREMSWEDFTKITNGFKKLRQRLHNLDIYGENNPISQSDPIYRTTELFYDSDCMDLIIKDKKGKTYDFIDLATELYNSLGRHTVFDTSGWYRKNPIKQKRAEKYAQYFSEYQNMGKLSAFNVSFNVFNASYIASVKALKKGDIQKAKDLRERFVNNMANTLFTFTPLLENPKFDILVRAFGLNSKNSKYFDISAMYSLIDEVLKKVESLYKSDLNGPQKYIKTVPDYEKKLNCLKNKLSKIDTGLNSSGRMKSFMKEFGIIDKNMLQYDDSVKNLAEDIQQRGRFHRYITHRLIDTDGKVYHMTYASFFPTEIQLNITGKDKPAPALANLYKDFLIDRKLLNRPEEKTVTIV